MPKKENALKTMNSDLNSFSRRHIGVDKETSIEMLKDIGFASMDDFIQSIVPENIYSAESLNINDELSEAEALRYLEAISKKNKVYKTYIGQGFYNSVTPAPIIRNIFENPGWYTSYTPYQPEIAQGRLEALINYQTMVCDLTGMEIANASLLDEPTASLDVSVQARILELLSELQHRLGVAQVMISHNLGVIRHAADRVAVMYLWQIVETGTTAQIYAAPAHPYTQALFSAIPHVGDTKRILGNNHLRARGEVASALNIPTGCPFHPRCPQVMDICRTTEPALTEVVSGQSARCHLLTPFGSST